MTDTVLYRGRERERELEGKELTLTRVHVNPFRAVHFPSITIQRYLYAAKVGEIIRFFEVRPSELFSFRDLRILFADDKEMRTHP